MVMVAQTPKFVVPDDWHEVMEDQQTRSAEHLIARVFTRADAHHTCSGPVASEDGILWRCAWCGAHFSRFCQGAHARNTPRYLSDLTAVLELVDDLRRRDPTLTLEIDLCSVEGSPDGKPHTRIYAERAVAPDKAAYLTRFVQQSVYATPKRSPLCVAVWEALLELYEFAFYA